MTTLEPPPWVPPTTHGLMTPDGRVLRYCLYGPEDGIPVVVHNGTPGTRWMMFAAAIDAYEQAGFRALVYDRPGYGGSDRQPGRSAADAAADTRLLADQQGWDRFAVTGTSGGGPHALACAALLPDRIARCAAVVSPAPFDAEGLDWFEGMTEGNVEEFRLARQGESALRPLVESVGREALARIERGEPPFPPEYDLSESDLAEVRARFGSVEPGRTERSRALWVGGFDGWIDDELAFTSPWGFDVSGIGVPVSIWYGPEDVLSPPGHSAWLLARIPDAERRELAGGHMANEEDRKAILDWLRY